MTLGAQPDRCASQDPAPDTDAVNVRPSRAARRKIRRERCAAAVAAGVHVPGRPRSHYQTADIRDDVQSQLQAQRAMMAAHRRVPMDPSWHFDEATKRDHEHAEQARQEAQR